LWLLLVTTPMSGTPDICLSRVPKVHIPMQPVVD
jgi:hypothetical protein